MEELSNYSRPASPNGPPADEAGFRAWVAARRPTLQRTAYLMTADWHHADDLVQEVLIKVYSRWATVAGRGSVDAYVRRALVTTYLDTAKRPARRETPRPHPPDTAIDHSARLAFEAVEEAGSAAVLALSGLPPGERAVLILRFIEDLSVEQAADVLSCSTGNIKSQTSRGLDRLRRIVLTHTTETEHRT